nr:cell wall-binding repeat-containing protein [uncultured Peptostreptococcus sp.]
MIFNKNKQKKYASFIIGMIIFSSLFAENSSAITIKRISGQDRYQTSFNIADHHKSDIAVLVSGKNFPDALSAISLSNKYKANIILAKTTSDILEHRKLTSELINRKVKNVYIVGGNKSVDSGYERELKKFFFVERIEGKDRYETSLRVIEKSGYKNLCIADGRGYPDALSTSALVNKTNTGLLLVDGSKNLNLRPDYKVLYTIGGPNSIKNTYGKRIAGEDRYKTCYQILNMINPKNILIASGTNFPDALSASSMTSLGDMGVLLCTNNYDENVLKYTSDVNSITVIGGSNSVSGLTVNAIIDRYLYSYDSYYNIGFDEESQTYKFSDRSTFKGWLFQPNTTNYGYDKYFYNDKGVLQKDTVLDGVLIDDKGKAQLDNDGKPIIN